MHAQSHDNDYASRRELQHALYFTRAGLGLIYTDGNHQAQTLGESGGAFPRHANTAFLGQFLDPRVPNLLYIHNQFARGTQIPRYSDADFVAYERMDKRENTTMSDADGATMLFLLNDNYASGVGRTFNPSFAHTPAARTAISTTIPRMAAAFTNGPATLRMARPSSRPAAISRFRGAIPRNPACGVPVAASR